MSVGHSVTAVFNGVLHPFFIHSGGYAAVRLHAPATHLIAHKGLRTAVFATMWLRQLHLLVTSYDLQVFKLGERSLRNF